MNVAIIPARGGSKRIPKKNIREFCGIPMIAWSIRAAWASGCFERIIVSTDDEEISAIAREHGAEVPFLRPAELGSDTATTSQVIRHALEWIERSSGVLPTLACCLYATAPFVQVSDIEHGLALLSASDADFAFTVTSFEFPVQRAIRVDVEGRVDMLYPAYYTTRSQDLEPAFHDAGQFYWGRSQAWLAEQPIFDSHSLAIRIPHFRVQDIDSEDDWKRAELMFQTLRQEGAA